MAMMHTSLTRGAMPMRGVVRSFTSSAQVYAEGAPATSTPRPRSNPRSSQPDARPARAGGNAADRLRNGERSRNAARANGQASNRNAGGDRRNKRLPSVFDGSSPARAERAPRGVMLKGRDQQSQRMAAPKTTTDWNSPLYAKPGYERFLPSAPRASSIFTPNLSAAAAATPAAGGKGKGKAAAAPASTPQAKLNLPGIKTAVNALKLHIRPGGRNILGPTHDPVGVAVGSLTYKRAAMAPSVRKGASDEALASELKKARIALQNQQIGGSYERFEPQAVLESAGVKASANSPQTQAVKDAAQALSLNADLAPESKSFVAKTIAERLGA